MTAAKGKGEPPKSAAARAARLLSVAGSMAKSQVGAKLLRLGEAALKENRVRQATRLVQELSQLKGAAMKVGQILALEGRDFLPEEVVAVLEKLQNEASFLPSERVESLLRSELGDRRAGLVEVSAEPVAAASIGQVHRARSQANGQWLAVKVQYPGVRDAIDSDVRILGKVLGGASLLLGKQANFDALLGEFAEIFRQETDYRLEADFTERYGELARQVPGFVVPRVHRDLSSRGVLTLDFTEGVKLTGARGWTEDVRRYFAQKILELYTREFCEWGLVQTDPNLGNFLFRPESREIVLLDFGAVKTYSLEIRVRYARLILAVLGDRMEEALELALAMELLDRRESRVARELFGRLMSVSLDPFRREHFDFRDDSYGERVRAVSREMTRAMKFSPPPKDLIFLHRKLGGVFQIVRRLEVTLDLRPYLEAYVKLTKEGA